MSAHLAEAAGIAETTNVPNNTHYIWNDVTRRLCASAYLQPQFRRHVLRTVVDEEVRAIAPNPSIHLSAVVAHAVNAQHIKQRRDLIVIGIIVLHVIGSFLLKLVDAPPESLFIFSAVVIVGVIIFVTRELWTTEVGIVARRLSRAKFDPIFSGSSIGPRLENRLKRIELYQGGNIIIYSGFSPFSGSGISLGSWSFLVSIDKSKDGEVDGNLASKVSIAELYRKIQAAVEALQLAGLSNHDRLYVNGRDVRAVWGGKMDSFSAPIPYLNEKEFNSLSNESLAENVRHYRSIHIESWQGELVVSMYYRLQKRDRNLFVEVSFFLLCPLAEAYKRSDSLLPTPTFRQGAAIFGRGLAIALLFNFFWYLVVAWKCLLSVQRVSEKQQLRREAKERYDFDYGARTSIREYVASTEYSRYFQKLDKEYFSKVLDKTLLESILAYLDERGIDTSELKERTNVILNKGILVTGGKFEADAVAVGTKPRVLGANLAANLAAPILHRQP
jgi:hypothetical protein